MANRINIEELKSYLWNSAVLLRSHIDAGAYKQYIFPLLFFKRICDVYDEELELAKKEYGDDFLDFAEDEIHTFIVPKGYHWKDVRQVSENVGTAIVDAFRQIEKYNLFKLQGVFGDAAWTNKNRLPDKLLKDLIEHFSSKTLSLANCPEDELGQGYEYLIKKFADDSGHTAQEFYTNRTVVHLMTEMLKPQSGESIYDPTCGSAGMLISSIAYLKAKDLEWRNVSLFGQEINNLTSGIARMNLFLHGVKDFKIVNDDTLKSPAFIENGKLQQFDLVLANPPYSIKQWDREAFASDKYGRNFLGTPPQGRADYAFFQHILKSLKPKTGRCAILFPHGVLFRDEEKIMRENLVQTDLVECVIGIGKNLFFNSPMEACIIICRTNKDVNRRGKILFIDAKNEVTRKSSQSYLEEKHISKIANTYLNFEEIKGFSAVVDIDTIQKNNNKLSVALYVHNSTDVAGIDDELDLNTTISEWMTTSTSMWEELDKVITNLKGKMMKEFKFDEIVHNVNDKAMPSPEDKYKYVGLEHLESGSLEIKDYGSKVDIKGQKLAMKKGDILFGRRNTYLRRVAIAPHDGLFSAHGMIFRPKEKVINNSFLPFFISSDYFMDAAIQISVGSLSPTVNWGQLKELRFKLPELKEQEKLADILSTIENLKNSYKKALEQLDEIVKSQFIEMFESGKFPYYTLDNIAKEWLKGQGLKKEEIVSSGENKCIHYGELFTKYGPIIEEVYSQTNALLNKKSKNGDILFPASDVTPNGLARCSALLRDDILLGGDIIVLRPKEGNNSSYISFAICMQKDQLLSRVAGAVVKHMSTKSLQSITIPIAPIEEQDEFILFAKQIDKSKFEIKQSLENLTKLQKHIINDIFR